MSFSLRHSIDPCIFSPHRLHNAYVWPICLIATGVARNVDCLSVCVLGPWVRCAKTAKPIEMPFGADSCESNIGAMYYGGLDPACRGTFESMQTFAKLLWTLISIVA